MTDCEWMFGDAATGILGFHALADLNPLRWSGSISFDKGIADMEALLTHGTRPIIVKVPSGMSTPEKRFETPEEVIEYLKSVDPKRMDLKAAADLASAQVIEREELLAKSREEEQVANTTLTEALAASGQAASLMCEWMYADAGTGHPVSAGAGQYFARFNPFRWSGGQTYAKTISDLGELVKKTEETGEAQRSITLRIPPGLRSPEETFETYTAAIDRLSKDVVGGGGETEVTKLEDAHELAKQHLADAEAKLDQAKLTLHAADAAVAAAA